MNKMKKNVLLSLVFFTAFYAHAQNNISIIIEPGEQWWTGVIKQGHLLPFKAATNYSFNLYGDNLYNQTQPLLLSNKGRYVWSQQPFQFNFSNNTITITGRGKIESGRNGNTLQTAQQFVRNTYFPASGKMPDSLLFLQPQYNTWIELNYHHNQKDILKYAHDLINNGFPPGVFMIDDTWQEDYGIWDFHPGRFNNPKAMVDELHQLGFKVMLWVVPFMSPDQAEFRKLRDKKIFLLEKKPGDTTSWQHSKALPAIVSWWNGQSAVLDFSNPDAVSWFEEQLQRLQKDYGIDGFKFDAADFEFYNEERQLGYQTASPNLQAEMYAKIGLNYPLNEFRACWKMAGQPLVQRLHDKNHSWEDLQKLVPHMLLEGLAGYTFSCPDMIGGGEINSFWGLKEKLDQQLVVRSAQCHALMPMMQFSVAPWRILNDTALAAVKKAVVLRKKFIPLIIQLVKQSAQTGEPIVMLMEYVFPNQQMAGIKDQFMLGNKILVAPVVVSNATERTVILPIGNWKADDGKMYKGGKSIVIKTPLDRLPYFELMSN